MTVVGENKMRKGYKFEVGPGETGYCFIKTDLKGFKCEGDYSSEARVEAKVATSFKLGFGS